jgi:hypothetical protein
VDRSYNINAPSVVAEIIDGEAVIMDLRSGRYFSAQDVGSRVWEWIEQGRSRAEMLRMLGEAFDAEPGELARGVDAFIADLVSHELVMELPAHANGNVPEARANGAARRSDFAPPVLNVYTDMRDLLLLDPIHEVDEGGWPLPKGQAVPARDGAPERG